jgi:hypothetical protein
MPEIMELEQPHGQCCERKIDWRLSVRHNIHVIKYTIVWVCEKEKKSEENINTILILFIFMDEMQELRSIILELEKQQKEKVENDKKMSLEYNFQLLRDLLTQKKQTINNNRHSGLKTVQMGVYYDRQLVTHVEAIYNLLQIMDARLKRIEDAKQ